MQIYCMTEGACEFSDSSALAGELLPALPRKIRKSIEQKLSTMEDRSDLFSVLGVTEDQEENLEDIPDESDDEEAQNVVGADMNWVPNEKQKRDLKMAHDNCGHLSNSDFARLLRRGNCKPEVAAWYARISIAPNVTVTRDQEPSDLQLYRAATVSITP